MRTSTACMACRSRRRRCDTTRFGTACKYCIARGFQCTRDTTLSPTTPTPTRPTEPPTDPSAALPQRAPVSIAAENRPQVVKEISTKLPPQPLCIELVHLYFDLIHDQFHSLFHRPTFLEDVVEGRVPPVILLAIFALSARFSSSPIISGIGPRDRGKEYAKESSRLLDLRDVSITTAQACVLLGAVSITEGEPAAESVYYSTACRIASLLDLPNRASADGIDREVNIRVWWSLTMIDVWSSSGVRLPRQMIHLDNVPLPVDESLFLGLQRGQPILPNFDVTVGPNSSLLAQMIQLNSILKQINDLNEGIVSGRISGTMQEENVTALSNKLDSWHAALPINMHDTHENLNFWASQGLGRIFVAVYLGFYHFGQLLFYQFLHENHSNISKVQQYANKCKAHAASLCDLVYAAQATPNCEVLYTMVGHILVVASTVQIHTLLFSENENQISTAKRRLEKNFEILSRLQSYWPTLDISFTRLRAFHQACRKSMETSFRMDQWMLRFLYEFAEPVDDKFPESGTWSLENIGISPQSWTSN